MAEVEAGRGTRLIYGSGAAAFGIKDNGFSYLLLVFYNQVLGLPAELVGLMIMLALFADAVADPVIGYASDRTRGRWGRRHPWMYAAAVPAAIAYWALWNPPAGLSQGALLGWLLALAVLTRLTVSSFEIPNAALVAELTQDYDGRTRWLGWRFLFGWAGGIGAGVAAFALFLQPTPDQPMGLLNREGYAGYSIAAALGMMVFMLASSAGTHRLIPALRRPPAVEPLPLSARFAAVRRALSNRPFLAVLLCGLFANLAGGLAAALNIYFQTWFWALTTDQVSLLVLSALLSAILALPLSRVLSARFGKQRAAVATFLAAVLLAPAMLLLRLAGLLPPNGAPALLPLLIAHSIVFVALIITASILISSMLTDTIEVHEVATGERVEGFYFAANFFVQKLVSGLGVGLSGVVIALAGLPRRMDATPPPDALVRLALWYIPLVTLAWLLAVACLSRYRLTRDAHRANLAKLRPA